MIYNLMNIPRVKSAAGDLNWNGLVSDLFSEDNGTADERRHVIRYQNEAETKWPPFCRRQFQSHFLEWKVSYFDWYFTDVIFQGPIDNKPALVQVMAWRRTGDKPLFEPMVASFTNTYMHR